MIGVFWIYKDQVYGKTIEADKVQAINNYVDSDFSHYQVWDDISRQNKDFYLYEYEDIPRGRVVYDVKNDNYIVYANNDVVNSANKQKLIVDKFCLNEHTTLFKYDEHYRIIKH